MGIFLSSAVSLAQIIATLYLARVVDRVGRRLMTFIGLYIMTISLVALAISFWLTGHYVGYLALVAVLLYRVSFSISLGPMPYIITAEIFPNSFRASGVSLCWAVNWATNFMVSLSFLPMMNLLSTSVTFIVYAVVCIFAVWFVYACVPETRGQTLEQLEETVNAAHPESPPAGSMSLEG